MKKIIILVLIIFTSPGWALLNNYPQYMGFGIGSTLFSEIDTETYQYNPTQTFSFIIGKKISDIYRIEIEYSDHAALQYTEYENLGTEINNYSSTFFSSAIMLNNYITYSKFFIRPYIGIGIGVADSSFQYIDINDQTPSGGSINTVEGYHNDTQFAYQGIIGLEKDFPDTHWTGSLEFKHYETSLYYLNTKSKIISESVIAKMRYTF